MANVTEAPKRRALGKGLESLLPRVAASVEEAPKPTVTVMEGTPLEIPLDNIERNPYQTRKRFDELALAELAGSIVSLGVVQPIVVRPLAGGRYQLIAGERRWLASRHAGKETIPAILKIVSDEQAMEMTIIENLQRVDLNPMEQARAYDRLSREFKMTQEQMALRTGKERASVSNFLRLMRLPEMVQGKVESGELSFGHAKALMPLENPETILKATQKILALSMSVRQTENFVQGILNPERRVQGEEKANKPAVDPNVREAEERLQRALGLRVRIEDKHGRGRVIIEYSRLEDFDGLMDSLVR
jgi:ParB family transcriptional regulator, chromosome partitioning protein